MNIDITYPEVIKDVQIDNVKVMLGKKRAMVETWADNRIDNKEINLQPILDDLTDIQLKTIEDFFSNIIALSVDLDVKVIPDEIFKAKVIVPDP